MEKNLEITNTEICDNANKDFETGEYDVSGVSVLVEFIFDGESFTLDFQTSTTADYGAISSHLLAYNGTAEWDRLYEKINNDCGMEDCLDEVKKESKAQESWNEYISENYTRNTDYFGGMDADSEFNTMIKKEA